MPTAMALVCNDIVTESMTDKRGVELWGQRDRDKFAEDNRYEIDTLFKNFPPEVIYYHPVKLSKWKL